MTIIAGLVLTIAALGLQFYHFFRTLARIRIYKNVFPGSPLKEENIFPYVSMEGEEINLIKLEDGKYGEGFVKIVDLINRYLEKNKNAADFGIIRSIVDSSMSVHEEDISSSVSLPLYIGLMGTFAGVSMGLISIAINGSISEQSIDSFIHGVIIAMAASFVGLLLTVINNAHQYKRARSLIEKRKNDFFNFLRIHLLPYIGNDLSDVVNTFKNNINRFNTNFGKNLNLFDAKLSDNVRTLSEAVATVAGSIPPLVENTRSNQAILQQLQSQEMRTLLESNSRMLTVLESSVPQLIDFTRQQESLSQSMEKTAAAIASVGTLMDRIRRFEDNLNALGDRINTAEYLGFDVLQKIRQKLDHLDSQFELLKQHSQQSAGQLEHHLSQERVKIEQMSAQRLAELQHALNFNIEQNPLQKLLQLDSIAGTLQAILEKIDVPSLPVYHNSNGHLIVDKKPLKRSGLAKIFPFLNRGRGR
jgi:archaellum component FlaC